MSLDFSGARTTISGLSIGLFAAAAISVSDSVAAAAINGVESVRVAFRLGIHVDSISGTLEARDQDGAYGSWAYVVTGLSVAKVQEELDRYNTESVSNLGLPELAHFDIEKTVKLTSASHRQIPCLR